MSTYCQEYTNSQNLSTSVAQWRGASFNVLPLPVNSKRCRLDNWQVAPVNELWQDVGVDFNIGVRLGGPLQTAVADGDSPRSVHNIADALRGLGASFICTTTATPGHVHFWLNVTGTPSGESLRKLSPDVGKGEFRFGSGAYVVAPHSVVDGRQYTFVNSTTTPHDIASLRAVRYADLARVLLPVELPQLCKRTVIPRDAGLVRGKLPLDVLAMLDTLANAPRGVAVGKYASRSECEFAVVLSAINYGWTFDEVARLFGTHQPGHYADYKTPRAKERYLALTWRKAMTVYAGTPVRVQLADAIANMPRCWRGRGGALDAACYNALLKVAYTANSLTFGASVRQVCELASAGVNGAHNALRRLRAAGLVERTGLDESWRTSQWTVKVGGVNTGTFLHSSAAVDGHTTSELWAVIGKSVGMIYAEIGENDAKTARILAKNTGKCLNTVKTALVKLEKLGLAQKTPEGWTRGTQELGAVITDFECGKRAAARRERHDAERRAYRRCHA